MKFLKLEACMYHLVLFFFEILELRTVVVQIIVPCAINQGDCDKNSECQGDLVCGKDNCPAPFPSTADCCESPYGTN